MRTLPILAVLALVGSSPASVAQNHKGQAVTPEKIQWGPAPSVLPKGAEMAVLAGDPSKRGPFTARLKMPAGYKIAAHQHPTAEAVTVISGAFHFGMADKLDETLAEKLGPGGFVDLPPNMNHFAFASVETVVQINSEGPFAIKYVNPSDDPSKNSVRGRTRIPKFIIEREMPQVGKLTDTDFQGAAQKSCDVLRGLGPEVQWIESYVTGRSNRRPPGFTSTGQCPTSFLKSLNHLVSPNQQSRRHPDPEQFRSLEVHEKHKTLGLLDGKFARMRAFQDAVYVTRSPAT